MSAAMSTAWSTLRRPNRRTPRSLLVSPPSLNTGWLKVFVVTISMTRPALVVASLSWDSRACRVASSASKGKTSLSWKVIPHAPSSASLSEYSHGSSAGRVAMPNGSAPVHPTVHSPNENLSCGIGVRVAIRHGRLLNLLCHKTNAQEALLSRRADIAAGPRAASAARRPRRRITTRPRRGSTRPARGPPTSPSWPGRCIAADPAPTRADVAAATSMTRSTVSRLVDDLVDGRVVAELDPVAKVGTRPSGDPARPGGGTVRCARAAGQRRLPGSARRRPRGRHPQLAAW